MPLATVQDQHIYWYQCDLIGTPQELTDATSEVVWAVDYKVWGEAKLRATGTDGMPIKGFEDSGSSSRTSPIEQPFRFQGQQFDEETGLHYNRFRYYDPTAGRFVSQDPIGLHGGVNLFSYGINSFGYIDPLGLKYKPGARAQNVVSGKDKAGKNNVSEWRRTICAGNIKNEMEKFLGENYVKVDEGKWRSLDGARQFRVNPSDYSGGHGMGSPNVPNTPHVHFEFLRPTGSGNFKVTKNVYVPLNKGC